MATPTGEELVKIGLLVFNSILWEAFPFVVLGSLIAGFLEELVPQQLITRVLEFLERHVPKRVVTTLSIGMSALLGLIFPMCECGIIPVMRRLLRKGLPLSCCVAYILAGPIINPIVMMSTYSAFMKYPAGEMGTFWMVLLRCGLGYVVACVTATVVHQLYRKHGFALLAPLAVPPGVVDPVKQRETSIVSAEAGNHNSSAKPVDDDDADEETAAPPRSLWQRAANISETALHDFIDIMVFLVIGAVATAIIRVVLLLLNVPGVDAPLLAIPFMMAMAILMCLCSEADAFVAANFKVAPAAKLSFLVLGPMLDLKLYLMYTRVFRPRLIWTIITCVVVQVFVYSLVVHFIWEHFMGRPTG
jgi:uncharacterized membrane protein YraQ (UPF0718 family)